MNDFIVSSIIEWMTSIIFCFFYKWFAWMIEWMYEWSNENFNEKK